VTASRCDAEDNEHRLAGGCNPVGARPRNTNVVDAGAALLVGVREGDVEAFEAALAPVIDKAHRLATAMLHDAAAAEDAVQEASIKAWRKLDRLREGAEMGPWFLGIVANECRTTLRSRWRRSVGPLSGELGNPGGHGAMEAGIVASQDMLRALSSLRHGDRLVIALRFWLDMPVEEIAKVIGKSPAAAKATLYRAIERLRGHVEPRDRA
jgi:RNA polymerase sigma-70 factor, ECF subfamily